YIMLGVNIIAADSEEKAHYLATSQQQHFINIRRNNRTKLLPPVEDIQGIASPSEMRALQQRLHSMTTIMGDKDSVRQKIEHLLGETGADELIIHSQIFSHEERLNSFEIVAQLMN